MNQINNYIEQVLNNEQDFDESNILFDKKTYKVKLAKRLLRFYCLFKDDQISLLDFLACLRNYLVSSCLTLQIPIELTELIMPYQERYGIKIDVNHRVYAVDSFPDYIDYELADQAFIKKEDEKKYTGDYYLGVSPYIYHLTDFSSYKSIEQKVAVTGALNTPDGYTTLVALPTGGGKSLVTQSVAYQKDQGLSVVIVPTVSLALDQKRAAIKNIKHNTDEEIFCYYSGNDEVRNQQMLTSIQNNKARLVFLSPEAIIKNRRIADAINQANERGYLKNIIVDEAHIVIEWGSFFRVDYQCLEAWRKRLVKSNRKIRTFLLSATFEKSAVENLKSIFLSDLQKWIEIRCDSLRKEPRFLYIPAKSYTDKIQKFVEMVDKLPRPMVVYVSSPDTAEKYREILFQHGYKNVPTFTGKTKSNQRKELIESWANDEFDLIIATSAFGVGVDKPDVRTVLHLYVPNNPNQYYQELGRGGRDGLTCLSVMCIQQEDLDSSFRRLEKVLSIEKISGRWFSMLLGKTSTRTTESIYLDTTIKPHYNTTDEDDDLEGTAADIKWNIYVILLLKRYGVLQINDMTYDYNDQKYFIEVKITDYCIIEQNLDSYRKFEEIRTKEWKKFEREFSALKNSIMNYKTVCWSEMFMDTYDRVTEYCGGCFTHKSPIGLNSAYFPLEKKVSVPIKDGEITDKRLWNYRKGEILIKGELFDYNTLVKIINLGVTTIVLDSKYQQESINLLLNMNKESQVNFVGVKEFDALVSKQSWYWISGVIMILHSGDGKDSSKLLNISQKVLRSVPSTIIHYYTYDSVHQKGMNLFEHMDAPHIDSYLLKEWEE